MSALPLSKLSRTPLFILAVALAAGLLLARLLTAQPMLLLIVSAMLSVALAAAAIFFGRARRTIVATSCVVAAFVLAGLSLKVAEENARPRNRLSQFYERQIISSGDPVELTGRLDGPAE